MLIDRPARGIPLNIGGSALYAQSPDRLAARAADPYRPTRDQTQSFKPSNVLFTNAACTNAVQADDRRWSNQITCVGPAKPSNNKRVQQSKREELKFLPNKSLIERRLEWGLPVGGADETGRRSSHVRRRAGSTCSTFSISALS